MRTLQWQKIPANKIVLGKPNMWRMVGNYFNGYKVDFDSMDELFALNNPSADADKNKSGAATLEKKKKSESSEVIKIDFWLCL